MRFLCTILETSCELFQNTKLKKIPWQTKHPYSYHFGSSGKDAKSEKCACCLVYPKHPTRYIGSEAWSKVARGTWPGFSPGFCAHPGWPGGVGSKGRYTPHIFTNSLLHHQHSLSVVRDPQPNHLPLSCNVAGAQQALSEC